MRADMDLKLGELIEALKGPGVGIVNVYDILVDSARGKNLVRMRQEPGGTIRKTPVKGPGTLAASPERAVDALRDNWRILVADELVKAVRGEPSRRPGLFLVVIPPERMQALRSGLVLPGGAK